jgi:glycosyltransferase involved in cell wall biosynthesis
MRLLFCCEYYHPSRGGVQEVMRQIAEHLVAVGHEVTVATTRLAERTSKVIGGVTIAEFDIHGNLAHGLEGESEIKRYQSFLKNIPVDAILIKAAQQWTFDAAWPVLDAIRARKVFIPCGFSGLYLPEYAAYFRELPDILRKFDHLIFYAERYRDIDFARLHDLSNFTVLPNGASEVEFAAPREKGFRARLGIADDAFTILTVGSPINAKGHAELAAAFAQLDTGGRSTALILNGQWPHPPESSKPSPMLSAEHLVAAPVAPATIAILSPSLAARVRGYLRRALAYRSREGTGAFVKKAIRATYFRGLGLLRRAIRPLHVAVWRLHATLTALTQRFSNPSAGRVISKSPVPPPKLTVDDWIVEAQRQPGKLVLKTHLSREDTVQAFFAADLFVFASNIEYSPLVLFEAAAAGTPFLTVPVGNAEEIVRWTGGGQRCPAANDERGYTRVDPAILAVEIARLIADPDLRRRLGEAGREAWRSIYNWAAISRRYETILTRPGPAAADIGVTTGLASGKHWQGPSTS